MRRYRHKLRTTLRRIPKRPLFSAVFLLVFCSQFSHFYTTIELENFLCYEATHQHAPGSGHPHDHDHDSPADGSQGNQDSDDGGFAVRHCKDTFGGIAMSPIQPFGSTVVIAYSLPEPEPVYFSPAPRPAPLADLHPPFQPPRA